jgi:hypothetical protein
MVRKTDLAKRIEAHGSRHFVGDHHPVFRKTEGVKGKFYTDSIYYWWFVTLRRSKRYEMACLRNGYGMTELYNDFGDVFAYDETKDGFRSWWYEPMGFEDERGRKWIENNRGAYLFAEPPFNYEVERLERSDLTWVEEYWDAREFHVITIPNNLQKREVLKRVSKALDTAPYRTESAGKRFKRVSKARYPVESAYRYEIELISNLPKKGGHLDNIKNSIYLYDDWEERQRIGDNAKQYEVMWEAEGDEPKGFDINAKGNGYERGRYGVKFQRRMKTAESLIAGVEEGRFPVTQWKGYNKQRAERAKTEKKERKPIERKYRKGPDKR